MEVGRYLADILDLLEAEGSTRPNKREVAKSIALLLDTIDVRMRGPASAIWAELTDEQVPYRRNAKTFRAIARSADPLSAIREADYYFSARILEQLRGWWRRERRRFKLSDLSETIEEVSWNEMGPEGSPLRRQLQKEVRCKITEFANYELGQIRRGAPPKSRQQTALMILADHFISFTGKDCDKLDLPHGEADPFIRFAHQVLAPYFAKTEVSAKALSQRYRRAVARRDKVRMAQFSRR